MWPDLHYPPHHGGGEPPHPKVVQPRAWLRTSTWSWEGWHKSMAWISPLEELKLGKRERGWRRKEGQEPFEGWDTSRWRTSLNLEDTDILSNHKKLFLREENARREKQRVYSERMKDELIPKSCHIFDAGLWFVSFTWANRPVQPSLTKAFPHPHSWFQPVTPQQKLSWRFHQRLNISTLSLRHRPHSTIQGTCPHSLPASIYFSRF